MRNLLWHPPFFSPPHSTETGLKAWDVLPVAGKCLRKRQSVRRNGELFLKSQEKQLLLLGLSPRYQDVWQETKRRLISAPL